MYMFAISLCKESLPIPGIFFIRSIAPRLSSQSVVAVFIAFKSVFGVCSRQLIGTVARCGAHRLQAHLSRTFCAWSRLTRLAITSNASRRSGHRGDLDLLFTSKRNIVNLWCGQNACDARTTANRLYSSLASRLSAWLRSRLKDLMHFETTTWSLRGPRGPRNPRSQYVSVWYQQ